MTFTRCERETPHRGAHARPSLMHHRSAGNNYDRATAARLVFPSV